MTGSCDEFRSGRKSCRVFEDIFEHAAAIAQGEVEVISLVSGQPGQAGGCSVHIHSPLEATFTGFSQQSQI